MKDWALSQDIAQETFLKVLEKAKSFQSFNKYSLGLYMLKTSRNLSLNYLKKNKRYYLTDKLEENMQTTRSTPEQINICKETLERILKLLSEKEKRVLLMKYLEGKEDAEIAERIGISPQSVRVYISQTRKKIDDLSRSF